MIKRAITSTTINGQIALVNASSESLLILQATNRHAPTGGVIKAKFSESTMIIPKWIGSIPKLLTAIGCRIGPKIIRAAAISINMPTNSSNIFIARRNITGESIAARTVSVIFPGIFSKVSRRPKQVPERSF